MKNFSSITRTMPISEITMYKRIEGKSYSFLDAVKSKGDASKAKSYYKEMDWKSVRVVKQGSTYLLYGRGQRRK